MNPKLLFKIIYPENLCKPLNCPRIAKHLNLAKRLGLTNVLILSKSYPQTQSFTHPPSSMCLRRTQKGVRQRTPQPAWQISSFIVDLRTVKTSKICELMFNVYWRHHFIFIKPSGSVLPMFLAILFCCLQINCLDFFFLYLMCFGKEKFFLCDTIFLFGPF